MAPSAVPRLLPYIDIYIFICTCCSVKNTYAHTYMHTYTHAHTDISNIHTIQTLTCTRKYAHAVTSIPPHTHTPAPQARRGFCTNTTSPAPSPRPCLSDTSHAPASLATFGHQYPRKHSSFTLFSFLKMSTNHCLFRHLFIFRGRAGREGGRGVQRKLTQQSQLQRIPAPQTCPPRNQRGEEAVQPRPSGRLQAAVPRWMVLARQQHW